MTEIEIERLAVLVFLHDIGKLMPGFQAKGWSSNMWRGAFQGHVREALDVFNIPTAADALNIDRLSTWEGGGILFPAVLAHHGRPIDYRQNHDDAIRANWIATEAYEPDAAAVMIGKVLPTWFPTAYDAPDAALPTTPRFEHYFAGLVALADWIGSCRPSAEFVADLNPDYMTMARPWAVTKVLDYGIDAATQRASLIGPPFFSHIAKFAMPNSQQALVGETDLDARLVILEAETGSGKTEAALWRYAQLFAAGRIDGMYFAVPTRSAAVQLHARVAAAAKKLFGVADPQAVLAVPGYLRAGDVAGKPLPRWQVRWDDDGNVDEKRLTSRWAAEDAKKYLAAQIAVGTVDQAMLGALCVKHAHVRAAALSRNLLVIDEVHASDRYMGRIQQQLVRHHRGLGGYAMLMSATLGSSARSVWLGRPVPDLASASATPYPAVWTERVASPRSPEPARKAGGQKRVSMRGISGMEPEIAASIALDAARRGARVLLIRNTVTDAVKTVEALEALAGTAERHLLFGAGGVVTLHHSRFAPSDRKMLDGLVEAALAPNGDRMGGLVIVGTQTLEQSLDICADFLVTDLCPIDVLLQRLGRLHRHDRPRPAGFERPQCHVLIPEDGLEPLLDPPRFLHGLGGWLEKSGTLNGIYLDLSILELTRRLIVAEPEWRIPEMNRRLVEQATHPEAVAKLGEPWQTYQQKVWGDQAAKQLAAQFVVLDNQQPFAELKYPSDAETIRTRLGGEGARITLETAAPSPFAAAGAEPIREVVLPAHWPVTFPVDELATCTPATDRQLKIAIGKSVFAYGPRGLRKL